MDFAKFLRTSFFYGTPPATASGLRFISEGSSYAESKNLAEDLEHEV